MVAAPRREWSRASRQLMLWPGPSSALRLGARCRPRFGLGHPAFPHRPASRGTEDTSYFARYGGSSGRTLRQPGGSMHSAQAPRWSKSLRLRVTQWAGSSRSFAAPGSADRSRPRGRPARPARLHAREQGTTTGSAPRRHQRRRRRDSHAACSRTRARWRSSYVRVFVSTIFCPHFGHRECPSLCDLPRRTTRFLPGCPSAWLAALTGWHSVVST